jgi:N-acetylmuramoyl-L-alanine amidase
MRWPFLIICFVLAAPATRAEEPAWIFDRPISFSDWRKAETLTYIRERYDPAAESIVIVPKIVVVHWTAIDSLEKSWAYFNVEKANPARKDLYAGGKVNVGIHFLVDRDGRILRLMPETWMARHCVGINRHSIGIENVGGHRLPLTEAQRRSNARLIRYLAKKYEIRHVIGHYEYRLLEGTPYWEEKDPAYRSEKLDPGRAFMEKLRAELRDLKFHPLPAGEKATPTGHR